MTKKKNSDDKSEKKQTSTVSVTQDGSRQAADKVKPQVRRVSDSAARITARSLMPDTKEARQTLKQRALAMAQLEEKVDIHQYGEFLRFRLGDKEEYGIPYEHLDEILSMPVITQVPCTPAHIAGVVNRRGEVLTVLDLQPFFMTHETDKTTEARIIVVSSEDVQLGILVDEVITNERYALDKLAPALVSTGVSNLNYVKGIYGGRVTMLNVDALLSDEVLRVDESVQA